MPRLYFFCNHEWCIQSMTPCTMSSLGSNGTSGLGWIGLGNWGIRHFVGEVGWVVAGNYRLCGWLWMEVRARGPLPRLPTALPTLVGLSGVLWDAEKVFCVVFFLFLVSVSRCVGAGTGARTNSRPNGPLLWCSTSLRSGTCNMSFP